MAEFKQQWIVVVGTLETGFHLVGPFETENMAATYQHETGRPDAYRMPLFSPLWNSD